MPTRSSASARAQSTRPRVTAIAIAVVLAALFAGINPQAAFAANGNVTGVVFRDYNANGIMDTGNAQSSGLANDTGFAGVTVTATDDAGASWTTTSAADGTYTLAISGSSAATVRVEFTGIPAGYEEGANHSGAAQTGTAVQYVQVGSTDVDFALNAPEDYSQAGAPLVTAIQWAGSPLAAEGGDKVSQPALVGLGYEDGYTAAPQPGGFPNRVTLATFGEVGAISSNVYQASSNSIFAAAAYKRQSGLGPLGLGGIYRVTDVLDGSNNPSSAGAVVPWLDVAAIGIDVGTALTNVQRGISGAQTPTNDADAFAKAGTVGIGDMALSPDGNTLYFVNLFDKRLYAIDVSNPSVAPTTFQSFDLGLGTGERPWALSVYRNELYAGFVDSGETAGGSQPGQSAAAANLEAHVIKASVSALGGPWTQVFSGDLGYTKGDVFANTLVPQSHQWNTWTDSWTWAGGRVSQLPNAQGAAWQIYPQPILSDLYFDEDGFMSLGLTDRTSLQGGNRNVASDPAVPGTNYEAGASGDTLIAAPDAGGSFTLENNGVVGSGVSQRATSAGAVNQGPGGLEFYGDAQNLGAGPFHQETTLGYLAGMRGTHEVVTTSYDPLGGIRLGGLSWMSVDDGAPVAGYELTPDGQGDGSGGNFQKGGGLGGISLLALSAPVEVGNRVWFDADHDGIQDPSEPPIANLTVELVRGGVVVGTTTTSATGEYYFSSDPTSAFYDADLVAGGGAYTMRFVKPTTGNMLTNDPRFGTVPWSIASFTSDEPTTSETGSNPDPATGEADFTVGGPGENDHSIDAGFVIPPTVDIEKGDGSGTTITHDADTNATREQYAPGESRTIVFRVTNTGPEPLRNVELTEDATTGAEVTGLVWTMPDGSTATAVVQNGVLTARWGATFSPGTTEWAPGDVITGTATLVVGAAAATHVDTAGVTAVGANSGIPVDDTDDYHAFSVDPPVVPAMLGLTGSDVTGVLILGLSALAVGVVLLITRRRHARA